MTENTNNIFTKKTKAKYKLEHQDRQGKLIIILVYFSKARSAYISIKYERKKTEMQIA